MLQVAICEEDTVLGKKLTKLVERTLTERVELYSSEMELLKSAKKPEILILDLDFREADGMERARKIRNHSDAAIILLSAGQEHVLDAFDVEAFHYLLKPIDEQKFEEVLRRAAQERQAEKDKEPLIIRVNRTCHKIEKKRILYAENMARKIVLHQKEGEISYYARMEELEQELGTQFFRCHRGYLVNLAAVKNFDAGTITLKNNEVILLSKQKYNDFAAAYLAFLKKR